MKHSLLLFCLILPILSNAQIETKKKGIDSLNAIKPVASNDSVGLFSQFTISGRVVDDYSEMPIENAKVKVKDFNLGAFSDEKGFFTITIDQEFPIELITSYYGYEELITQVTSVSNELLIRLKSTTLNLGEVKVRVFASDREKESALSIETMSLSEIQETPSTDFYEGLSHMKGVDLTSASLGFKVGHA